MQTPNEQSNSNQKVESGLGRLGTRKITRCILSLSALLFAAWITPVLAVEPAGKDLRQFYGEHCAGCHGPDGSARSLNNTKLRGQDLTDVAWRQKTSDEKMVKTIQNGIFFGWVMPKYKDRLTSDEAQRMVTEIIRKSEKGTVIAPVSK